MYYTYVLYCYHTRKLYYGFTNDLERRLKEHKTNFKPRGFVKNEVIELIYYEAFVNESDAKEREFFYKTGWGRQYLRKILKNCLSKKKNPKS